ncbi:MAG: hypothetical protein GY839_06360 [candidate division Zixibacteria bacterium]|nr:hypothetical protein [candidate division Zixibacteria bacterium]
MSFRNLLIVFIIAGIVALIACAAQDKAPSPSADLQRLANWMTGSFSSQEQAAVDSNFIDIRLQMMPIWTERTDGFWLYVEQAVADRLEKPYRQRVYHLTQPTDTTFESAVYTVDEPLRFAGGWDKQGFLASMTPDSLTAREGCSIYLKKDGDSAFTGSTVDRNCQSELRGASYAVSEVKITETQVYSWDRGYDADAKQVWGAETGGYVFKKIIN